MNIYLAGPMRNIPHFNYQAFTDGAASLRQQGHRVFNPIERDIARYGPGVINPAGDAAAAAQHGLTVRGVFKQGLTWICDHADAVALLPGWEQSRGAQAEKALAHALDLEIIYL